MALTRMIWGGGPEIRPWEKGLGPTDPKRIAMWQELEAESIARRRRLGYLPPEEKEPEPKAIAPPKPPKPERKQKPEPEPDPARRAWTSLRELKDDLRARRGDDLKD